MFKSWFSSSPPRSNPIAINKGNNDNGDSSNNSGHKRNSNAHAMNTTGPVTYYYSLPSGQQYTPAPNASTGATAHRVAQPPVSIVVGRKGNVEIVVPQTAKHHSTHSTHPNSGSQPNVVLVSPPDHSHSSHTRRHEKPSPSPPRTSAPAVPQKIIVSDDRAKHHHHNVTHTTHNTHATHHAHTAGGGGAPRSDVATIGGSIAPRTISRVKHITDSKDPKRTEDRHRHHDDHHDSKAYPKSPHPSKPNPLPARHERSSDNHHHGHHQSDRAHTSSHQTQQNHQSHRNSSYDPHRTAHASHGKENVPTRVIPVVRHSQSHAYLQPYSHSHPQGQPHSHSRPRPHSHSHSPEKHVRYLDPSHPEIIPQRVPLTHLAPQQTQPHHYSAPVPAAPIFHYRPRRNSLPPTHSHNLHYPTPHGWFNRRGDQYIQKGIIRVQPEALQWHPMFASYPEVGRGWMDEEKRILPPGGGILKN